MAKKTDPFDAWRQWLDRSEHQINELLGEFTSSSRFSKAQARMMEALLKTQQGMNKAAERSFATLNMPSRTDILDLGGRLAQVEERLANIERVLLALVGEKSGLAPEERPPRPPRTRTPKPSTTEPADKDQGTRRKSKKAKAKTRAKKTSAAKKTTRKKTTRKKAAKTAKKKATTKKKAAKKTTKKKASSRTKTTTRRKVARKRPTKKKTS